MKIKSFFKQHPLIFTITYTIFHFIVFLALERIIKYEDAYIIHSVLDDYIPFCEYFIVPYFLWFAYIPVVVLTLIFKDPDSFWRLALMLFGGNIICLTFYAIFPNAVEPKALIEDPNIFGKAVNMLYAGDTPTNVCPSMHTLDTIAAYISVSKSSYMQKFPWVKVGSFIFLVLICIATVTLKQHSIIDVFAAFGLVFVLYKIAYRKKATNQNSYKKKECFK